MKKQLFSLLLLLSFVVSVSAQTAQFTISNVRDANLRRHVEYLASEKLEGRRTGEPGAKLAANYIAKQFAAVGLKKGAKEKNGKASYLQPFSFTPVRNPHGPVSDNTASAPAKSYDAMNVIGILPGTDPTLKNEAIVIGAHYDHLGRGGSDSLAANSKDIHYGADDNASGVAAIIELARMFKSEPGAVATGLRNKRTLIFIAFSGEEEGLFGSKFYVDNPVFPLDKTIAMINLDMVGRLNDNKLTIGGIGTASEWKKMVEDKNPKVVTVSVWMSAGDGIPTTRGETRSEPNPYYKLQLNEDGFGPSDHSSFYGKKIPVLFFFTGTHSDYHKPTDTAEKINYSGTHNIVSYVQSIVNEIDTNPKPPTYTVAKSSNTGGRTGFTISLGTIPSYGDSTDGMLVDGVRDGSPAAKAGVRTGDKIVKLAGRDIRNVYDYTDTLVDMKADTEYEIVVMRSGEKLTLKIVPVKR